MEKYVKNEKKKKVWKLIYQFLKFDEPLVYIN